MHNSARDLTRQAVIIAGGKATRLRPYTSDRPKILVEIAGRTILEWQAEWLASGGVEHLVVSSGYLADILSNFVNTHTLPLDIVVVTEAEPLGRGGGLKFAAGALPFRDERWLALNGDILTDLSIPDLCAAHARHRAAATVAVTPMRSPYGIVEMSDDDRVERFLETPVLPHWVNAGVYLFEANVADELPDVGDHETTTFPRLAEAGLLHAFRIPGYWRGIDTQKDVQDATREFSGRSSGQV